MKTQNSNEKPIEPIFNHPLPVGPNTPVEIGDNCPVFINRADKIEEELIDLKELSFSKRTRQSRHRARVIERTAFLGIVVCIIFFIVKYAMGVQSNSSALIADAYSSLTESYSSIIAIVGIMIAHKAPNKKHPMGYGRVEFLTAIIGSVIVIFTGVHTLEEGIDSLLHHTLDHLALDVNQILILLVTIAGKLFLFYVFTRVSKKYKSTGLQTSARASLLAAFLSFLVILSSVIYDFSGIDLDGYVSVLISGLIILIGIIGFKKGVTALTGAPVDPKTAAQIEAILLKQHPIIGVYDIFINNTGAGNVRGAANVEVPVRSDLEAVYEACRKARKEIERKLNINMVLSPLAVNYCDPAIVQTYHRLCNLLLKVPGVTDVHGFKWDQERGRVDLTIVTDFERKGDDKTEDLVESIVSEFLDGAHVCAEFYTSFVEDTNQTSGYALPPLKETHDHNNADSPSKEDE